LIHRASALQLRRTPHNCAARSRNPFGESIMAMYESEHTRFMREWLENHPEQREEQKKGRALWWDKPQDIETQRRYRQAAVPVKAYYYDVGH